VSGGIPRVNIFGRLDLWCWQYLEKAESFPGLSLTGRPEACDVVISHLHGIAGEGDGAERTLRLKPLLPEDARKINGDLRYRSFRELRLVFRNETESLRQMCLSAGADKAVFEVTPRAIPLLVRALEDIKAGRGDYAVAPTHSKKKGILRGDRDKQSLPLLVWPCFGHYAPVE
jgi:hypothetical protein